MKWLITGGCGFIGTSLISRLIQKEKDVSIRVLDNLSASTRDDLAAVCDFTEADSSNPGEMANFGVELVVGDILDGELALRAAKGADAIIHLAAETGVVPSIKNPIKDCMTNVVGTVNMLIAARDNHCGGFVLASSGAPLGEQDPPIHEEKVPRPKSPYGASKLAGEGYLSAFNGSYNLNTVALRFGNVYGTRSAHKNSVVAKFIKRMMRGEELEIYGSGKQTRDFIFIDDLVDAIIKGATAGVGGEVFQIATHRETTVEEISSMLVEIFTSKTGNNAVLKHVEALPGEVMRNFSDVSKAKRILGWEPLTDLRAGLEKTVQWFLDHPETVQGE